MKKIVFLSLLAFCLPWMLAAQSIDDDLYYVPSKEKKEQKQTTTKVSSSKEEIVVKSNTPTTVYTSPGQTTIVVRDRKGKTRDIDEYNRRYSSKENDFSYDNDTLYVDEKDVPDPDGEWVSGFDGSQDDYEYAMRIIRFRNPRYAISISSPLYWDVVYGMNSWDWNVYTDGLYAYAFPTFSNRMWWDWRYNSYGWGWGYPSYYGWGYPSYGWGGFYNDWYIGWGGWYGGWSWGHHHSGWGHGYYPGDGGSHWGGGWAGTYTNRRSISSRPDGMTRRVVASDRSVSSRGGYMVGQDGTVRRGSSTSVRRVIGTRSTSDDLIRRGVSGRTDAASSRSSMYTRPSSTRSSSYDTNIDGIRSSRRSYYDGGSQDSRTGTVIVPSSRSSSSVRSSGVSTYSRGSSESSSRSYSGSNDRTYSTRSSSRSYESSPSYNSSSRSSSSSSSYSSGGSSSSSRSSGGSNSGGGGSSRSGGGRR